MNYHYHRQQTPAEQYVNEELHQLQQRLETLFELYLGSHMPALYEEEKNLWLDRALGPQGYVPPYDMTQEENTDEPNLTYIRENTRQDLERLGQLHNTDISPYHYHDHLAEMNTLTQKLLLIRNPAVLRNDDQERWDNFQGYVPLSLMNRIDDFQQNPTREALAEIRRHLTTTDIMLRAQQDAHNWEQDELDRLERHHRDIEELEARWPAEPPEPRPTPNDPNYLFVTGMPYGG